MVRGPQPPGAAGEAKRRNPVTLSKKYRPSKKPRKTWALLVWSHSPPNLIVWLEVTMEKLSLTWKRLISSSTFGPRKKGLPKRNVVANPIPVSGGTLEGIAE